MCDRKHGRGDLDLEVARGALELIRNSGSRFLLLCVALGQSLETIKLPSAQR